MTLEVDNSGNPQAPGGGARIVRYTYSPDMLNRSSVHDTATGLTSYEPSPLNQYSSVGGMGYSYDYNFNLTAGEGFSGTYDAANRLVAASNSGMAASPEVELVYDGLGRCVKRTINGVATVLVYDEWKPIAEWDEWGYIEAWNVYGPGADEILLRHRVKVGYIRFHADANGNVAFLVDNDGRVIEKYSYDAFGKPKVTDGDGGNARSTSHYHHRFLFQGREYIDEAGVYDYRNRFYHPGLGRFLQKDPTGFDAGDMNLFRYCGDDPIDGSDPDGLADRTWATLMWWQSGSPLSLGLTEMLRLLQNAGTLAAVVIAQDNGQDKKSTSWQAAGRAGATEAIPKASSDKEGKEWKGLMLESKTDRGVFVYTTPVRGTRGQVADGLSKPGNYNTSAFDPKDAPAGFRLVGGYWALPRYQLTWPEGDRRRLYTGKQHGVLGMPPPKGASSSLTQKYNRYLEYEYDPDVYPPSDAAR